MRINTQFPVAVHILAVLAYFEDEQMTSEDLARSVGTNPGVVRRLVPKLKKAGLVDTRPGARGTTLCRRPADIPLSDIYNAVRAPEDSLFDIHPSPSQRCVVGRHIKEAVHTPLMSAQMAMERELGAFTLADVMESIRKENGE